MAGPKSRLAKYLFEDYKRIGDKPSGTFDGGLYTDPDGVEWFIKEAPSDDHANNEVLASKLYAEAGVKVPEVDTIRMPDGSLGVMSRKAQINRLDPDNPPPGTNEGYAADAWLANWDTAGLTFDNMYESGGEALRLDAGGALRYRAQGAPKGRFFGDTPGELDTLRDEDMNPQSSRLFRNVTDEQIKTKANQIREIPESRIKELVELYGPEDDKEGLLKTLLARRSNLPAIAATLGVGGALAAAPEPAIAQSGRWGRDERLAEKRQEQADSDFVGRLSRDRGDLYAPEREWAVAGAEAVQNLPGGEFVPFMDQVRKWGWGDQMQPTDYAMMALDATDFIPGAAAIGLPAKRMAKQATEEAIQSRLMAGEAVEEIGDADYGTPPYQEDEVGFDLQGLIDDILKESNQKGSEDLVGYKSQPYDDPENVPGSLNSMFASAAKQLGQDPGRLIQKNIDKSVPMSGVDFDDQYVKTMKDMGYTGQPEDLPFEKAQEMYLKMSKWYKQETGQNIPHPYDLTDVYGPGVMHLSPPVMFDFFRDVAKGANDPSVGLGQMATTDDQQFWKGLIDENWTAAVDKGLVDPKNWGEGLPKWYTFPNGTSAGVGGVDLAKPEIFQPFHDELAAKGLANDPQSRLQRAAEHGFRFKFDTPMQPHHVTGGHFKGFNPQTGELEDASDLTEFKSSRGPMGSFVSIAPYDLTENALQSEEKYRRSYPVGIQGRMFAFDEPDEWYLPKEISLPDAPTRGWNAERLFNKAIAPNIPEELQDFLHQKGYNSYMRNLWTGTAGNRYAPSPDDPTKLVYQGPATKTMQYNPDYVPQSGGRYDASLRTGNYTFTAPFEPPHFLTYEDYTYNADKDKVWPYQEIIEQMGYKASKVDDEAGWSIAARPINKRSLFANFDPDRMEGGSNPSTNIMAGLGLTAVSLPAIMAELTGDDEDGYWAGLLQKQMSGNGYD